MDPYCPLVAHTRLPDNANLVAPKGGAAGSMPINTPQVPLSSLSFLLDDFSFQVSLQHLVSTLSTVLLQEDSGCQIMPWKYLLRCACAY